MEVGACGFEKKNIAPVNAPSARAEIIMNNFELNSKGYWNYRYQTDWDYYGGMEQTVFFCKLALNHLPSWLLEEIHSNSYRICDVGCAGGEGVHLLSQYFPSSSVMGIDFSDEAVKKASRRYPKLQFRCENLEAMTGDYDVIFSSNVIEHFKDPIAILNSLLNYANKYVFILVPFQEYDNISNEHVFIFDYDTFPPRIGRFQIKYTVEIDCKSMPNTYWPGKQLLVIYSNTQNCP
jgi:hypothetical protein